MANRILGGLYKAGMELGKGAAQLSGVNQDWSGERKAVSNTFKKMTGITPVPRINSRAASQQGYSLKDNGPYQEQTMTKIPNFKKGVPGIPSYKKGGKIKKTGIAYLHKGEEVLTKKETMAKALAKKKGSKMDEEC